MRMSNNDQLRPSPSRANLDEERPLLCSATAEIERNEEVAAAKDPKLQLFLICYARLLEPILFFSIFAFISEMVSEVGEDCQPPPLPLRFLTDRDLLQKSGVLLLHHTNALHGSLGANVGSIWSEADPSLLSTLRSLICDLVRIKQEPLADDSSAWACWDVCRHRDVR